LFLLIFGFQVLTIVLGAPAEEWFKDIESAKRPSVYAFECDHLYSDTDFYSLVGFTKLQFRSLLAYLSDMRQSHCRSKENALGMFLMKWRHNTTQDSFMKVHFELFN